MTEHQQRRDAVLRRLRWAGTTGRTEAEVARSLGVQFGTGALLRELAELKLADPAAAVRDLARSS